MLERIRRAREEFQEALRQLNAAHIAGDCADAIALLSAATTHAAREWQAAEDEWRQARREMGTRGK